MGGRGSGSNKTQYFHGYKNGEKGEYSNHGYRKILELPIGAEFSVINSKENFRTKSRTQRYRIDELDNDGQKHLFTVENWGKKFNNGKTYIAEAAVNSVLRDKGNVKLKSTNEYLSPIKNLQRMIGNDAVEIRIYNGGQSINKKNRKTLSDGKNRELRKNNS